MGADLHVALGRARTRGLPASGLSCHRTQDALAAIIVALTEVQVAEVATAGPKSIIKAEVLRQGTVDRRFEGNGQTAERLAADPPRREERHNLPLRGKRVGSLRAVDPVEEEVVGILGEPLQDAGPHLVGPIQDGGAI